MLKHLIPAIVFLVAAPPPVSAHHSPYIFASDKEVMLTGTVVDFEYTNPHSWIRLVVPQEGGQPVEWSIETVSPIVLNRAGIERTAFEPGEKVTVRVHPFPMADSGPSGWLIDVKKADGTVFNLGRHDERSTRVTEAGLRIH